jgi:signal transduction histidine kinase
MLLEWQNTETDEFALAAISDALTPPTSRRQPKMLKDLTDLGRTFRFIADRLRHNVLNAIPRTGLSINRLSAAIKDVEDAQLGAILDECLNDLRDSVVRLEAAVSIDYEVDAFEPRDVHLVKWILQFVRRYASQWPTVAGDVIAGEGARPIVTAPPYLLELIFANLFDNARHATGESTMITIVIKDRGRDILLYVLDNGQGFSDAAADAAFTVPFAASAGRQGRGLMEVNDAVTRIGGVPSITNYDGRKCVELLLPRTSRSSEDK